MHASVNTTPRNFSEKATSARSTRLLFFELLGKQFLRSRSHDGFTGLQVFDYEQTFIGGLTGLDLAPAEFVGRDSRIYPILSFSAQHRLWRHQHAGTRG